MKKMRITLKNILVLIIFLTITSCSYTQPYPDKLRSTVIEVSTYIITEEEPYYICSSSLFGYYLCPSKEKEILQGYQEIDLKNLIRDNFTKQSKILSKMMEFKGEFNQKLNITESESGTVTVDFTNQENRVKTDYILIINLSEWGFIFHIGRPYFEIIYSASIHNVKNNKVIFIHENKERFRYNVSISKINDAQSKIIAEQAIKTMTSSIINNLYSQEKQPQQTEQPEKPEEKKETNKSKKK